MPVSGEGDYCRYARPHSPAMNGVHPHIEEQMDMEVSSAAPPASYQTLTTIQSQSVDAITIPTQVTSGEGEELRIVMNEGRINLEGSSTFWHNLDKDAQAQILQIAQGAMVKQETTEPIQIFAEVSEGGQSVSEEPSLVHFNDGKRPLEEYLVMDREKIPVKELRGIIPKLRMICYFTPDQLEGKKKMKHLWETDKKPADWPAHVPFVDPNNGCMTPGRNGEQTVRVKPGKNELLLMFDFLKENYYQKKGGSQPEQEESKLSHHMTVQVSSSTNQRSAPSSPQAPAMSANERYIVEKLEAIFNRITGKVDEVSLILQKKHTIVSKMHEVYHDMFKRAYESLGTNENMRYWFVNTAHEFEAMLDQVQIGALGRRFNEKQVLEACDELLGKFSLPKNEPQTPDSNGHDMQVFTAMESAPQAERPNPYSRTPYIPKMARKTKGEKSVNKIKFQKEYSLEDKKNLTDDVIPSEAPAPPLVVDPKQAETAKMLGIQLLEGNGIEDMMSSNIFNLLSPVAVTTEDQGKGPKDSFLDKCWFGDALDMDPENVKLLEEVPNEITKECTAQVACTDAPVVPPSPMQVMADQMQYCNIQSPGNQTVSMQEAREGVESAELTFNDEDAINFLDQIQQLMPYDPNFIIPDDAFQTLSQIVDENQIQNTSMNNQVPPHPYIQDVTELAPPPYPPQQTGPVANQPNSKPAPSNLDISTEQFSAYNLGKQAALQMAHLWKTSPNGGQMEAMPALLPKTIEDLTTENTDGTRNGVPGQHSSQGIVKPRGPGRPRLPYR